MKETMNMEANNTIAEVMEKQDTPSRVSIRAVIIGAVALVIIGYIVLGAFFSQLRPGINVDDVPNMAAIVVMLALLAVGLVVKPLRLKPAEHVVIYTIVAFGAVVLGKGFLSYFIVTLTILPNMAYFESPALYRDYYNIMSPVVMPKDIWTIQELYMGEAQIVWGPWIGPIIVWTIFLGLIILVTVCLMTIVRRHWTEHEHLAYPVTVPLLAMMRNEIPESEVPFFKNKLMWLGALIPIFVYGLNGLHRYFPAVPEIRMVILDTEYLPNLGPYWAAVCYMIRPNHSFIWNPATIGLAYLAPPLDLVFSTWFFFNFHQFVLGGIYYKLGWLQSELSGGPFPYQANHTTVCLCVVAISALWMARSRIREMWRAAIGLMKSDEKRNDENEPVPLHVAFWGGIIGFVLLVTFTTVFLKLNILLSIAFFTMYFLVMLSLARIRAEVGFPINSPVAHHYQHYMLTGLFGKDLIGRTNMLALGWFPAFVFGNSGAFGAMALESYKMADETNLSRRSINRVIVVVVVLAALLGFFMGLPLGHKWGLHRLESHVLWMGRVPAFGNVTWAWESGFDLKQAIYLLIVSSVTVLLTFMRMRFVWWPFHPLGFALMQYELMTWVWFSAFIAWLIKFFVYRYGGRKLYKKSIPFFVGMIAGQAMIQAFWAVVGVILGR